MTLAGIRNGLVLLIVALYFVPNAGFMLVRVPPAIGSGVPVGEFLLFFFILTFIWDMKWLPHFSRSIFLLPFGLWWALGIGRALAAVPEHGFWALRAIEFTRPMFYASLAATLFTLASIYPLIHWLGLTGVMGGLLTIPVIRTVILASGFNSRLKDWQPAGTENEPPVPKTDRAAVDGNV